MTKLYTSIFDGATIITRKDLCGILNLDISRPGLKFSAVEIQKAYRKRALRFHPDTQKNLNPPIPTDICNVLMNDLVLARDYMLKGEDNILGKAFVEKNKKSFTTVDDDLIEKFLKFFNEIQKGTSKISSTIPWMSRFSNNFFMILLFSTFANNQLNFKHVNAFSKELDVIRPYLKYIDGSLLATLLSQLKDALESTDQKDVENLIAPLKEILPKELTQNKKFDDLLIAFQEASKELTKILTKDFIAHIEHIIKFWSNFAATLPSWRYIVGVYFMSLLVSATSLPKYFMATKAVIEVIWKQKGVIALILSSIPILAFTVALLPLNIAIQFGIQLSWIILRASYQILKNSMQVLQSTFNIFCSLFGKNVSLSQNALVLFKSILNLTVRLTFNIVVGILDGILFILSNHSMLSSFQSTFNNWLDSIFDSVAEPKLSEPKIEDRSITLISTNQNKGEEPSSQDKPNQSFGFFDNSQAPLHNAEDIWLKQLLANISEIPNDPLPNVNVGNDQSGMQYQSN